MGIGKYQWTKSAKSLQHLLYLEEGCFNGVLCRLAYTQHLPPFNGHLQEVLRRLREARLKINIPKCKFFMDEIKYLGHVVSNQGIHTDPDKIAAIKELAPPTNLKELRRYLEIASWYRRFVPEFLNTIQPMTALLKKGKKWIWSIEQQEAFDALKQKLTTAPVLTCPDFTERFTFKQTPVIMDWGLYLRKLSKGKRKSLLMSVGH
ncbi:uncharacterized mitochondrial protein AtMg00860-like [Teleopsis dalmanni]|uniref:uncharacterized mitochondrial protein AtMg00860-like n=1 Tax=Teleopsis dalmanni TaxID=139649 RepID=UPI0018CC8196|nr:uncharacterized mitochondrial protein AtMg00860-like [Teleopsis dalmanni]